jgi:hypothetical protein
MCAETFNAPHTCHPRPANPDTHPTHLHHAQSIEGEGHDRYNITLPGFQEELINQVAAASKGPVIVVVSSHLKCTSQRKLTVCCPSNMCLCDSGSLVVELDSL